MSLKYSHVIKTVLFTAFYAPAMPFAIIFSILGLVATYWIDKVLLYS